MSAILPVRLENALAKPKEYARLGLVYRKSDLPYNWISACIRFGLESGESVLFLASDALLKKLKGLLETDGLDLAVFERSGQIKVLHPERLVPQSTTFKMDAWINCLAEMLDAIAAGTDRRSRLVGDPSVLPDGSAIPGDSALIYRSIDDILGQRSIAALWLMDLDNLDPRHAEDIVQYFPWLVINRSLCRNLYYMPADAEGSASGIERKIALLMDHEKDRFRSAEVCQQLERDNQLLLLEIRERKQMQAEQEAKLIQAMPPRHQLTICSKCKSVRDENKQWHPLEEFLKHYSQLRFSHGLCPRCSRELFPGHSH
jgi:hypothetical protein